MVENGARRLEEKGLTRSELQKRLTLGSTELVAELWSITQKQVDAEIARQQRLDTKATSLLTAVTLSLTVAFTFGSTVLTNSAAFHTFKYWVVCASGLSVLFGLGAALFATAAFLLIEQLQVAESMVFDSTILQAADAEEDEKDGVMEYRKSAIIHLWMIRQRYSETYTRKARLVKASQILFILFIISLLFVCAPVVLAVLSR